MSISTTINNNEFTIILGDKFDFDVVENFRNAYTDKNASSYTVDFRSTEYMDSSGLGMLLNMKRHLEEQGVTTIKLINCRLQIKKILIISRFESKFIIT
jgi:HptB-dependent secretion and biofilm anti anti-sigma factor